MRDMGTHLCALPTGDYCQKGLVCLGCAHAQPKKSAAPVFRRMAASHRRALAKAREVGEPAGQIAARQLEVERIEHALRRAEELEHDVAEAIEARRFNCSTFCRCRRRECPSGSDSGRMGPIAPDAPAPFDTDVSCRLGITLTRTTVRPSGPSKTRKQYDSRR